MPKLQNFGISVLAAPVPPVVRDVFRRPRAQRLAFCANVERDDEDQAVTCVSMASAGRVFEWGGEREHWQGLLEQRSAGVPGDVEPSCRRGQRQISRLPALLGKVPRGIHWVSTSSSTLDRDVERLLAREECNGMIQRTQQAYSQPPRPQGVRNGYQ